MHFYARILYFFLLVQQSFNDNLHICHFNSLHVDISIIYLKPTRQEAMDTKALAGNTEETFIKG